MPLRDFRQKNAPYGDNSGRNHKDNKLVYSNLNLFRFGKDKKN